MTNETIQLPTMAAEVVDAESLSVSRRRALPLQLAATLAARVLMGVNSLVTGVLVARFLGASELGSLAVLNVTVAYGIQIGGLGLAAANTYFIARDWRQLPAVAMNSLIYGTCAGGALAVLIVLFSKASPRLFADISLALIVVAAVAVPFQLLSLLGLNLFLAVGLVERNNLLELLGQSLLLGNAFIALIVLQRGLPALITLNTAAGIAVSLLIIWLINRFIAGRRDLCQYRPDKGLFGRMLSYGLKMNLTTISFLLLFRIDLLIVKYFRGSAETGVYSIASQVVLLLMLPPGVISTLLFPHLAAETEQRATLACFVTRHATFVMFILCLTAVPAIFMLPLLYGRDFSEAVLQSLILLPGVCLVGIGTVLSLYFSGAGLPLPVPLFWLGTLLFNIAVNVAIVPILGGRGAAIASSMSYALIFTLIASYFHAHTGQRVRDMFLIRASEVRMLLRPYQSFLKQ